MSFPIERIVAATDFSEQSARALQRAAHIAAAHEARLDVIAVLPGHWLSQLRHWLGGTDIVADAATIELRLAERADELRRDGLDRVEARVLEGDPRTEIARYAAAQRADLVVVGSHGRSLIGDIVMGSTALALLERSSVPILMVRRKAGASYRRAVAGVAFEPAAREAIKLAAALFPDAELTLAHVYEDPFAAELFLGQATESIEAHYRERARSDAQAHLDRFVEALGPMSPPLHTRLLYGPPGLRLAHLAEHVDAELVVLGSRHKSAVDAALLGSVAANVALMVPADVLLVREPPG